MEDLLSLKTQITFSASMIKLYFAVTTVGLLH